MFGIHCNCTERDVKLLEDARIAAAARLIAGLTINSSRSTLYHEQRWDSEAIRRKKYNVHRLVLFYKIVYRL